MIYKKPLKKNFYLTVVECVKNTSKLPNHKALNVSKQRLNYYVKKLKVEGIIKKIGYGVWIINKEEQQTFNSKTSKKEVKKKAVVSRTIAKGKTFTSLNKNIRSHGFVISLQLPVIENWVNREAFFIRNKIKFKSINKNYKGQSFMFKGFRVWVTNKSIVIYFPKGKSYYSSSAENGRNYALYDSIELIKSLESLFNVSLKINKEYRFKVGRQHYAKINDDISKHYRRNNKRLVIRNNKGVWCITDYSFNVNELETVNKDSANSDMDNVIIPFMNDLKSYFDNTKEVLRMSDVIKVVSDVANNQREYAENIKSHIKAIQDLGKGVKEMSMLLKEMEKKRK